MSTTKQIAIIGAGEIGSALGQMLKRRPELHIEYCDKDTAKSPLCKPVDQIVPMAQIVFLCVPSWATREALIDIKSHLNKHAIVVSLSKGIEAESGKTTADVLKEGLPKRQQYALLSGPMLAEELEAGYPGAGVVATDSKKTYEEVAHLFVHTRLALEMSKDVRGVALSGVLKNVFAIGLGLSDGLLLGSNAKGVFVVSAMHEMAGIVKALGGKAQTAFSDAGLGDLVATGSSPLSRNYSLGREIATTGKQTIKSDGLVSLPAFEKLLGKKASQFPFFCAIRDIVLHHKDSKTILDLRRYLQ